MVQKYQSPVRVYKYPFELVMAAYERRFPTCPMIPIFVGSDTVNEFTSDDGAIHVIERRCRLNVDAPYLLKKIAGVEHVLFIQTNSKDLKNRALKIVAYNESFATRVIINETCNYFVHPENPDWTCFDQSASLEVKSFFGFENVVEKIAIKQYSINIAKGKEIIEYFIDELRNEGITYVAPWVNPDKNSNNNALVDGGGDSNNQLESSLDEDESCDTAGQEDLHLGAEASSLKSQAHTSLSRQRSGSGSAGNDKIPVIRCESFTDGDDKYRLDADYIKRYLGELSLLEESKLIQLRTWLAHLQKGNMPSDATLLRFLRAGDFNIEKAREQLSASLNWRKKCQVDKILSEYEMSDVVRDYWHGGWHLHDKDGRPVYTLYLGMMDVKGIIKSLGEDGLLRLTLHICEEGLRLTEEATVQLGHPVTTWTLLLDLDGLNMRHLWRPGIRVLLRIIEIVEANYPETLGRVLIIRAPRVFPVLWTLVQPFIDERTRSKFFFYAGNDYLGPGGLPDYIEKEKLPEFLDGCTKTNFGELVPKTYYMPEEHMEHLTWANASIYKSVSLTKGQLHELVILNEDVGSVLTWDFDVLRHEVLFSLFRTKHPIPTSSTPPTPTGTGSGASLHPQQPHALNTSINPSDHKSVIEKTWKEGQDYFQVEPSLVCHDGESVQGSHITLQTGYYILQWKYNECPSSSHHIMDSNPKAKVMYYYEILKSADYRGSLSSLHSQTSGFSSLGSKTDISGKSVSNSGEAVSSCPSR